MANASAVRSEVRRLQQQERRQQKVDGISDAVLDSALLLLWHTHGNMRCMYQYLDKVAADMEWRRHRRKLRVVESLSPRVKRPRDRTRVCPETWVNAVENRWSSWSLDDELSVFMADSRRMRRLQAVKDWLRGERLVEWLSGQNEKAVAASGPAIVRARDAAFGQELRPPPAATRKSRRTQRQRDLEWVRRWARRKGVLRGRFRVGPGLSLREKQVKATCVVPKLSTQ